MLPTGRHLIRRNRYDGGRRASESYEFDLVGLLLRIDVHDGPDITRLKALIRKCDGQDDSVVLGDHFSRILKGMGRDQSWDITASVDDPHGAN